MEVNVTVSTRLKPRRWRALPASTRNIWRWSSSRFVCDDLSSGWTSSYPSKLGAALLVANLNTSDVILWINNKLRNIQYGKTAVGDIESSNCVSICLSGWSMPRLRRPQAVVNTMGPPAACWVRNCAAGMHDCTVASTAVDVMTERAVVVKVVTVTGRKLNGNNELGNTLVTKNFFCAFLALPNGILAWTSDSEEAISSSSYVARESAN